MEYNKNITQGQLQTPYDEITFTIPAGGRDRANVAFSYFRLLNLTGTGLRLRFGQSGSFSSIVGAGIGIDLPEAVSIVEFENTSGADVIFTMAYSMGRINDDRLNFSGSLSISTSLSSPLFTTAAGGSIISPAHQTLAAGASMTVGGGGNINNRGYIVKNPTTSGGAIHLAGSPSATVGHILEAAETIFIPYNGTLVAFNPNAFPVTFSCITVRG